MPKVTIDGQEIEVRQPVAIRATMLITGRGLIA